MKNKRLRLYLSVDRLSLIKVHEYGNGNSMSLWMAMEDLAFENAGTYPSKSFIIDHVRLGDRAGIHFSTVKRICKDFEELGLLSIKRRRKVGSKEYERNFYTLHYPKQPIDHSGHGSMDSLDKQLGMPSMPPPLPLRGLDAMPKKPKQTAAARHKAEKQEAVELVEANENRKKQAAEAEQLADRIRLLAEKEKADKVAAKQAEDARRLARRSDVGSCKQAIMQAAFDEYDPGTFATVWGEYNCETVMAAVAKLPTAWADKVVACMKNNAWMFETEAK
jgi:hypothetical protein